MPITEGFPPGSTNFQCSHIKDHSAPFTYTVHYRVVTNKLTCHCYLPGCRLLNKLRESAFVYWWGTVLDLTASKMLLKKYSQEWTYTAGKSNCAEIQQLDDLPIHSQALHHSSICHQRTSTACDKSYSPVPTCRAWVTSA